MTVYNYLVKLLVGPGVDIHARQKCPMTSSYFTR